MKTLLLVLLPLTALALPTNKFYWPSSNTGVSVCAYRDNAGKDWKCGSNRYSGHQGTDIGLAVGNNALAAAAGTVNHRADGCPVGYVGSTCGGGFGNHVSIFHGNGDETIYGHLGNGTGVSAMGAAISCGDRLGATGSSGSSSGPHLHFETRVNVTQSNYYSGAADDPFAGACSGPLSYWAAQGGGYSSACGVGTASPQSATTCGCPAGTYALWNCNEAGTERVRCVGGQVQKESCPAGCEVRPLGTDDVCKPAPMCPAGVDGTWRCSTDGSRRQRCTAGIVETEACGFGCPAGGSVCSPMPQQCPAGIGASWSCDGNARQRCVAGKVEREACSEGCVSLAGEGQCKTACPAGACPEALRCPGGTYPQWTCAADGKSVSRCSSGVVTRAECPLGCTAAPPGIDDSCAVPPPAALAAPEEVHGGCAAVAGGPLTLWLLLALTVRSGWRSRSGRSPRP